MLEDDSSIHDLPEPLDKKAMPFFRTNCWKYLAICGLISSREQL
jgi:hypothetical protein